MAVSHADYILELQSNLDSSEMPPEWKWPLPWEMERHMNKVLADRKKKYGTDNDDDDDDDEEGIQSSLIPDSWRD